MAINWYTQISTDMSVIPDFIAWHENEILSARFDCTIKGNVEKNVAALPGITEYRFGQLQMIEAVLKYLELQLRKIRRKHFQKYMEAYNRQLTSRDAEKYMEGEDEVVDFETIINSVALLRNQYLGIIKGLEQKSFAMGHLIRLRTAGMEDFTIG